MLNVEATPAPAHPHEVLPRLLGDFATREFFEQCYGREPVLCPQSARFARELASVETCRRLITRADVDVMLVRDGRPAHVTRPSLQKAEELFSDGFTWVLRDVDHGDDDLAQFGRCLASELHGSLHLQVYRTPGGHHGFGWHFDPEEVFFIQTVGNKRMRLRRNTQHPHPIAEQMPTFLSPRDEAGPIVEHLLGPGDCLYIPAGYWHAASADEPTVSISAGVRAPSPIDALQLLLRELANDERWRARLPPVGRASPLAEERRLAEWSVALRKLGDHAHRLLADPDFAVRLFAHTGWWRRH